MRVKGVIKNSNFQKLKSNNSKNICRDFSGVVGTMLGQFCVRLSLVLACTCSQGLSLPPKYTVSALTSGF